MVIINCFIAASMGGVGPRLGRLRHINRQQLVQVRMISTRLLWKLHGFSMPETRPHLSTNYPILEVIFGIYMEHERVAELS